MKEGISDTIAAVATAPGPGGIGIIRISGPDALAVSLKLFKPGIDGLKERYLHFGLITSAEGELLDRGFLVFMKGPRSYTGEDVVELHCHGGPILLRQVLSAALSAGARAALPGEFTKRAFLNGKMDLAEAEAVSDIIMAETGLSLAAARGRLEGGLSRKVASIKGPLVSLLARLEAELDFPGEEVDILSDGGMSASISAAMEALLKMLKTFDEGAALREGVKAIILGRPNAGKSSLLNVLLQEDRAIVTELPGTTRDVIEVVLNIRGIPVMLMDTAGLRESCDRAEEIGIRLAREKTAEAGLVIYVADMSGAFDEDLAILEGLSGKKVIIAANKKDLPAVKAEDAERAFAGRPLAFISALKEEGIEELRELIFREVAGHPAGAHSSPPGELVASVRHRDCLERSSRALRRAREAVGSGLPREFVAADIREAIDSLGAITGETTPDDVLEMIFSSFCIGK
ncbi:MAG: tRNA uridine-5-carboxymethylaminomethyl(34) synthesis GTPase MnmE [Candidatus Methylomirabilis sp.]|nr:tRNA uridine-5-carboxymethylaminomethyl(34) synthesis GTPase MnmE [Deltaproteobacteria bacterium]